MDNAWICCTLRDDLLVEVKRLREEWSYDATIIKSSGISEPVPVAQAFLFQDEESGIDLWESVSYEGIYSCKRLSLRIDIFFKKSDCVLR